MSPQLRVLHTKNALAFFAQTHAAVAQRKFRFRRFKKTAKTEGFLQEECFFVGDDVRGVPNHRRAIFAPLLWGRGPTWVLDSFIQNRTAKNSAKFF